MNLDVSKNNPIISFVDRDMYMRYVGGGVGHYRVKLPGELSVEIDKLDEPTIDSVMMPLPDKDEEDEDS
ncbi:hypothetical protein C0992_001205, partial [Termitomyces sp. T32_za158]